MLGESRKRLLLLLFLLLCLDLKCSFEGLQSVSGMAVSLQDTNCETGDDQNKCVSTSNSQLKKVPVIECTSGDDCPKGSACFDADVSDGVDKKTCNACKKANEYPNAEQDKCILYATVVGGVCQDEPSQCKQIENSECDSLLETCECLEDFISNGISNNACTPAPPGYCTVGTDCSADPNSACLDEDNDGIKICVVCGEGQFPNTAQDKCLDYASEIGGSCSDQSQQCDQLENSECFSGTCSCPVDEYVPNQAGDKCLKLVLVGESCEEAVQCSNLGDASSCSNPSGSFVCICDFTVSYPKDDNTKCLRWATNVGGFCEEDKQCEILGDVGSEVVCDNSQCSCTENAVPTNDTKSCLHLVDFGGYCEEDIQCMNFEGAICSALQHICMCPESLIPDLTISKCVPSGLETFVCSSNTECAHIPGSGCLPGETDPITKCRCIEDYVATSSPLKDKCLPVAKIIGDLCEEPVQCQGLGGTQCKIKDEWAESNSCECRANLHPDPTNTRCLENIPE